MLEIPGISLQDFIHNVRIVDILDVALISVVFYLLLNWLIQSISRRTLIGFTILLATYVFARLTGMYLTELLIQALFVVILIALVVVFQSDIRRIVDRIGNWKFFDNHETPLISNTTTDIITEAASKMAKNKTGALIVIRGSENLDRHIDGGIELDGQLSIPLLFSIFNPTAPGHDGAVLLEGNNVIRFGTHLPLSKNLGKNSSGGTRHAAALGISEHCDALVIVVSEERGTISVAQSGILQRVDADSDLKNILEKFWQEHYQVQDSTLIHWWQKRDLRTAIASITLAMVLWFGFVYQTGTVYRTFSVPIKYVNLQTSNIAVQDSLPMKARVTLSGSEQAFRSLDPNELTVSLDLNEEDLNSNELTITQDNLNLSNGLRLYDVTPKSLQIKKEGIKRMQLPVKISMNGNLPDQLELKSVNADRKVVTVDTKVDAATPDSIATEAIDLSSITESTKVEKDLVLPENVTLPADSSRSVTIIIKVQKKKTQ